MYEVSKVMEFINRDEQWSKWYQLLQDEKVLEDIEIQDMLSKYGVAGIMGLRRMVFERQNNRITLEELVQAEDKQNLLQRLFLEPITKPMLNHFKEVMQRNGWNFTDVFEVHQTEPNQRIFRIISNPRVHSC